MATKDFSKSYAAFKAQVPLEEWEFELHELGPDDIEIQIAYCGMCHSDIHTIDGDWKDQPWPIVPGHEVIGYVTKVGSNVTKFQLGQRVGCGPQALSCFTCSDCKANQENYCSSKFITLYGSKLDDGYITKGGYAMFQRIHNRFAVPIPDSLPSDAASPLLCAGITVYSPFKFGGVKQGTKVAVIGIGGLGHLGIKIAAAMGAEVTAISTSESKREEAKRLGAVNFIKLGEEEALTKYHHYFDFILNTASAPLDWHYLIQLVRAHGTVNSVGLPPNDVVLPPRELLRHVLFTGTLIGSPSEIEEMLKFCAEKNIVAEIEVLPFSDVNKGIEKLRKSEAKYRYVLSIQPELDEKYKK